MGMNKGIWFIAGAAAGTLGTLLLSSERVRPMVTELVGSVLTFQDSLMKRVEIFKEDMEDVVAEAKLRTAAAAAQPQATAQDASAPKNGKGAKGAKAASAAPAKGAGASTETKGTPEPGSTPA